MGTVQRWLADATRTGVRVDTAARETFERSVRDISSVAVAAQTRRAMEPARRISEATGGAGLAPIWGTPVATDPLTAAFANAAAAQALEFDDIAPASVAHVGALMVPAMASLAHRFTGARAVEGYTAGLMVIEHFSKGGFQGIYRKGLQPTGVLSSLGSVGALLVALESSPEVRMNAFGLAANQLLGFRSHTGTQGKGLQAGFAASAAVRAVLLAEAGAKSGADTVDMLLRLIGISEAELAALAVGDLADPAVIAPRIYPTNGAAHSAIEAVIELRKTLSPGDPRARISVQSPPEALGALAFPRPTTPDQARFSLPFAIAVAWLYGNVTLDDFTMETVRDNGVAAVMNQIDAVPDPALSPRPRWCGFPAIVAIDVAGRRERLRVDEPRGYPSRPIAAPDFETKFVGCVAGCLEPSGAARVYREAVGANVFSTINAELRSEGSAASVKPRAAAR